MSKDDATVYDKYTPSQDSFFQFDPSSASRRHSDDCLSRPVALIIPLPKEKQERIPGSAKTKLTIPDTFFDPLPDEIMEGFYS